MAKQQHSLHSGNNGLSANNVFHLVLLAILSAAVLLVIPFTDTFVFDSKKLVLFLAGLSLMGYNAYQLFKKRSIVFSLSAILTSLGGLTLATLASTFLTNAYPYEALFGWGGILLMTTTLATLGHEQLTKKQAAIVPLVLAGLAGVLTIVTAAQTFGYGPSRLFNTLLNINVPNNGLFNLVESPFVALQVCLTAGAGLLATLLLKPERRTQPLYVGLSVLTIAGVVLTGWITFFHTTTRMTPLLTWKTNLLVAKGSLSSPKSALIGLGPNSFAHGYNLHKPATVNLTPSWNIEYANGANLPLTLVVTLGVFGLVSWLALVVLFALHLHKQPTSRALPLTWVVATLLVLQLAFPPSITMLIIFGVVLTYWLTTQANEFEKLKLHTLITRLSADRAKTASISITHVLSLMLSLSMFLFVAAGLYGGFRAFAASFLFFRSSLEFNQDKNANTIYELQKQAVTFNPYIDTNRRRYALTNLAVAQALANKPNLTDEERNQVLQLIQQAIREGRAAALIQPDDARNWEALANIYQNLVGTATGADQWTVSSFSRAIETDPTNPTLWFQLGSVFYQNKQYSEAAQTFNQAVLLKNDFLNAYYNLANALHQAGQNEQALNVYNQLLSRLPAESTEATTVQTEIQKVESALIQAQEAKNATAPSTSSASTPVSPSGSPSTSTAPAASVIEPSLGSRDQTIPTQNQADLSEGAQQYLQATPVKE